MSSIWPAVVASLGGAAGVTTLAASWLGGRKRNLSVTIRYADGEVLRFRADSADPDAVAEVLRRVVADGGAVHARMEPEGMKSENVSAAEEHPPTGEPPARD